MRIYNGTKMTLTLPYTGGETLTVAPKTPSGNVLCSNEFLSMVVTAYDTTEIAIIASGPFELTACANVPTAVNYVVQSLDEAIKRFNPVAEKPKKVEAPKPVEEPKKEEVKVEEPKTEPEAKIEEKPKEGEKKAEEPKLRPVKKEKKA